MLLKIAKATNDLNLIAKEFYISKNERAKRLMGLRPIGEELNPNFEFKCPICKEKLQLSEYNYFLWCKKCNIDMPVWMGWEDDVEAATEEFLDFTENIKVNPYLSNYRSGVKG